MCRDDTPPTAADMTIEFQFVVMARDNDTFVGDQCWVGAAIEISDTQIWAGQILTEVINTTGTPVPPLVNTESEKRLYDTCRSPPPPPPQEKQEWSDSNSKSSSQSESSFSKPPPTHNPHHPHHNTSTKFKQIQDLLQYGVGGGSRGRGAGGGGDGKGVFEFDQKERVKDLFGRFGGNSGGEDGGNVKVHRMIINYGDGEDEDGEGERHFGKEGEEHRRVFLSGSNKLMPVHVLLVLAAVLLALV